MKEDEQDGRRQAALDRLQALVSSPLWADMKAVVRDILISQSAILANQGEANAVFRAGVVAGISMVVQVMEESEREAFNPSEPEGGSEDE